MVPTMNPYYIKTVLMEYWRFTRQCLCADEVNYGSSIADIIILNKSELIHEIEVKCTKYDLCSLELKKSKHTFRPTRYAPNYFSFAVPTELVEDALKIINKLNPKYGLIEITSDTYSPITIRQKAQKLHGNKEDIEDWKHKIIYRLNSALIGYMKRIHIKHE
jgi:hypothetical protein